MVIEAFWKFGGTWMVSKFMRIFNATATAWQHQNLIATHDMLPPHATQDHP